MSNAIGFLESIGQDAELRLASKSELDAALRATDLDQEVRAAIISHDRLRIESLLGAPHIVCCAVLGPKPDEDEEEEAPSRDDDEISAYSEVGRAA